MIKIKKKIKMMKTYFSYLTNFQKLNKYVYLSSKFINDLDSVLYSDYSDTEILDNIKSYYSEFKVDYDFEKDFRKGADISELDI